MVHPGADWTSQDQLSLAQTRRTGHSLRSEIIGCCKSPSLGAVCHVAKAKWCTLSQSSFLSYESGTINRNSGQSLLSTWTRKSYGAQTGKSDLRERKKSRCANSDRGNHAKRERELERITTWPSNTLWTSLFQFLHKAWAILSQVF